MLDLILVYGLKKKHTKNPLNEIFKTIDSSILKINESEEVRFINEKNERSFKRKFGTEDLNL